MTGRTVHPARIVHADWGTRPKKRQVAVAEHIVGGYRVVAVEPALSAATMGGDLRLGLHAASPRDGQLLAGFDFSIGLPRVYARRAGISDFPDFLPLIGAGCWSRFADVAEDPDEISLWRPFYPMRPGGTSRADLVSGLGMKAEEELRRRADGVDAETLFWTLGSRQVGKATLAGWAYLAAVSRQELRFWPFAGPLATLLDGDPDAVVIAETYPREFYRYFRSGLVGRGRKGDVQARRSWAPALLAWADALEIEWDPHLARRVEVGFSSGPYGGDEFDAVVGVLGMIAVVTGRIAPGEPRDDPGVLRTEGWILGRQVRSFPGGSIDSPE